MRFGQKGTLSSVWARRGSRPTRPRQTEYDSPYVYGAVDPVGGKHAAMIAPAVNTQWMNKHLEIISADAGDAHVVLVLDNAGWHVSKSLRVPANITLKPLPPYSPDLNVIERLWLYWRQNFLSNETHADYDALMSAAQSAHDRTTPDVVRSVCRCSWLPPAD